MRIHNKIWSKAPIYILLILGWWACENPPAKKLTSSPKGPSFSLGTAVPSQDSLLHTLTYLSGSGTFGFGLIKGKDSLYYKLFLIGQGGPKEIRSRKIKNIGKVLNIESTIIKDTTYIYLQYLTSNKRPDNSIYFALLNPDNGFLYPIHYRYTQDFFNISTKYQAPDSLKKHPLFLIELAKRSAKFALDGGAQKFGSPNLKRDSLMKRWVMLNDRAYDEVSQLGGSYKLNTEEISGDLAPSFIEYENNDSLFKKNVSFSENGQIRISALKDGPVYGYLKSSKKTFLLWVPDQPDHYIKSIQLKENNVLFYDSLLVSKSKLKPTYEFNLSSRIIKKIK